jgi:hypothetical protein
LPKYPKITPPLVPSPQTVRWHKKDLQLPHILPILIDHEVLDQLNFDFPAYKKQIENHIGIELVLLQAEEYQDVCLNIDFKAIRLKSDEAYRIKIGDFGILIEVRAEIGLINALKTLKQIFFFSGRTMPYCYITDWPDRLKRGIAIDLATIADKTEEELEALLQLISYVKLNFVQIQVESYKNSPYLPWSFIRLKNLAAQLQIDLEILKELPKKSESTYLKPAPGLVQLGFNLEAQDLASKFEENQEEIIFKFDRKSELLDPKIFLYYQIPFLGAALWSWQKRHDSDLLLWLDDLVFNEMTGSAARLIQDLRDIFLTDQVENLPLLKDLFDHLFTDKKIIEEDMEDISAIETMLELVEVEKGQLAYLELQGVKGKIFLNQLILFIDMIILAGQYYILSVQNQDQDKLTYLKRSGTEMMVKYKEINNL